MIKVKDSLRRFKLMGFLCLSLIASGGVWDFVQVFAWGQMWINNLESQTAKEAFVTTFSEEGMCDLCKIVRDVKRERTSEEPALVSFAGKPPLLPIYLMNWKLGEPSHGWVAFLHYDQPRIGTKTFMPPVPPPKWA